MLNANFVIIGVILQVLGSWSYLVDTIKGKVKPNRVSWLLWAIAPLIAFFAMVQQGAGIQSLVTFIVGFVPLVIFIASFKNKEATWDLTKLDLVCGFLSIVGLVLWMITKEGNVAIFFSIVADALASIPTIVKSYKFPQTENATIFMFGVINALLGILTISVWDFANWGFPIYLIIVNATIAILVKTKIGVKLSK